MIPDPVSTYEIGDGKDKAGKARAPIRQGHVEGSRCTRETRVRYPWEAVRADQPSAPAGSSAEAKIERVTADPETICNWRRVDDRITTSGQPTELQLADIRALGVRHIINLACRGMRRSCRVRRQVSAGSA
jgi:hypothetical protein